ncbi:MAG: hypothetical protein H7X86_09160 [Gorillibacterium sp.]|nr:hypothetical protein [Gorillibacterium sp.]
MLKSRKYLGGLGSGLIIGAILVQLAHIGVQTDQQSITTPIPKSIENAESLTFKQLQKEAIRLDSVLLTKEQYKNLLAVKAGPSTSATASTQPDGRPNLIYIYIYQGMNSDSVEEYLYLAGIINDRVAFRDKIRSKGLTDKLKANLYSFTSGMDLDKVIDKLTGNKP